MNATEKIKSFAKLQRGPDTFYGPPPNETAINNALLFVEAAEQDEADGECWCVNQEGTIIWQASEGEKVATIEFTSDGDEYTTDGECAYSLMDGETLVVDDVEPTADAFFILAWSITEFLYGD